MTLALIGAYTSVGGFVSVVRGALMLFYFVTSAAGGVAAVVELPNRPASAHLFHLDAGIPFVVLLGIALAGSLKLTVDSRQVTRRYGLRDEHSIRVGILVIQFCLFPLGFYAHFLLDGVADTDLVEPYDRVPAPGGRFIAILAAMSSLDSVLLVAASVTARDLIGRWRSPAGPGEPDRVVRWTRLGVFAFAGLAAVIALNPPGGIVELTIFSGSLVAVCFVPTILLRLGGNETAALAAFAAGIAVLCGWLAASLDEVVHEVFPALFASVAAHMAISLSGDVAADPAQADSQVRHCFDCEAAPDA